MSRETSGSPTNWCTFCCVNDRNRTAEMRLESNLTPSAAALVDRSYDFLLGLWTVSKTSRHADKKMRTLSNLRLTSPIRVIESEVLRGI